MLVQIKTVAVKFIGGCNSVLFANNSISVLKRLDITSRHTSIIYCSSHSSSSSSWKPSNCKTIKEICSEQTVNEDGPKPGYYQKSPRTSSHSVRRKCDEVKETKVKETIVEALPLIIEKIDYTKVTCPVSKFEKPTACPNSPVSNNLADDTALKNVPPIFPALPKPPCGPVVLCHCPPPPKLHPGDCPCASSTPNTQSAKPTEPCRTKFKYSCPEKRIFYCPSIERIIIDQSILNEKKV